MSVAPALERVLDHAAAAPVAPVAPAPSRHKTRHSAPQHWDPRHDVLPVPEPLAALFPYGGLARGSVVTVDSPALALAIVAEASRRGAWCAAAGLPAISAAAAAEIGVQLDRFIVVKTHGETWPQAIATLLDGLEIVLLAPSGAQNSGAQSAHKKLMARARERRGVLVALGDWPERPDLRLRITRSEWTGPDAGYGRLRRRRCEITATGRGAAARERRTTLWLPPER